MAIASPGCTSLITGKVTLGLTDRVLQPSLIGALTVVDVCHQVRIAVPLRVRGSTQCYVRTAAGQWRTSFFFWLASLPSRPKV